MSHLQRLHASSPVAGIGLALCSALFIFLSIPKVDWWPLAWVAFVPVMIALHDAGRSGTLVRVCMISLAFGFLSGVGKVYWIMETVMSYGGLNAALGLVSMAGVATGSGAIRLPVRDIHSPDRLEIPPVSVVCRRPVDRSRIRADLPVYRVPLGTAGLLPIPGPACHTDRWIHGSIRRELPGHAAERDAGHGLHRLAGKNRVACSRVRHVAGLFLTHRCDGLRLVVDCPVSVASSG